MSSQSRLFESFEQFFVRCLNMGEAEGVDRLVELDLSMSQAKAVFMLAQHDTPLPINVLADHIRLSVASTGRIVDRLVNTGLVERHESAVDRRVKLVTTTRAGREAADQHFEAKRASMRTVIDRLTDDEADRLRDALEPLLAAVPHSIEQEIPA